MIFNVRYDKIVPAIFHVTRLSPRVIPARFAGRLSFARKKRILRYTDLHLFLCVDNHMGMTFNRRRQSRDSRVSQDILEQSRSGALYMSACSLAIFPAESHRYITVSETFLEDAPSDAFCFVEKGPLLPYLPRIRSITLYHWNRSYPGDSFFDIPLDSPHWKLLERQNMTGHSHEKITKERYIFCRE